MVDLHQARDSRCSDVCVCVCVRACARVCLCVCVCMHVGGCVY